LTDAADAIARAQLIVAHDGDIAYNAVVPPIVQSSLFTFSSVAHMIETFRGERKGWVYSRTTNPTVRAFEEKIAALESTQDAIGLASGMAAISAAVLAFASPGDKIVCVRHVYPDAYRLFETLLRRLQIKVVYVDGMDPSAIASALHGAKALYLESPTTWVMQALDVGALAAMAKAHRVVSIIDNSYATPVFQQPATLGVDLVVHSASKYISGHSDTVAGVIAGSESLIDQIRRTVHPYIGAKLAPFEAWLLLRGLRTLPMRLQQHQTAALEIARALAGHPDVTRVFHPALAGPLPPGLFGTSGLFSFECGPAIDIEKFCDRLRLFKLGVSWGGHESLVIPALVTRAQATGPNSARDFDVPERSIRLHVGLEGRQALWADLQQALAAARSTTDLKPRRANVPA
jgi:cystathionine beta-lyase/cystathionine gamma-synthase